MTEIFFIAYEFPPLNIGGVFRSLKFVKYFNEFNIKPIVFTLNPQDYSKTYSSFKTDNNLLKEIEKVKKEIIHVDSEDLIKNRNNKLNKFIQIYFNVQGIIHKKWEKDFFYKTEKKIKEKKPKAIIVTAPPFGVIELAVKLSKKHKIPLIIDMRDSFSMWVSQPYGSYFHYKITKQKEFEWFKYAKKVTTVTEQLINEWIDIHPPLSKNKFKVIPNGFDNNVDYSKIEIKPNTPRFEIGYVGNFYYSPESREQMFTPWYKKKLHRKFQYTPRKEDWLYRSPYFLFKTLSLLFEIKPEYKNKIFIKFAGIKHEWLEKMISDFNLNENVEHLGFLTFEESINFQKQCDTLLITSVKVLNGEDYCIAGKTFDYISIHKPILGFVTDGAQKQFLENSGVGIIFNPDNYKESAERLINIIDNGIVLKPNKEYIENFHRRKTTKELAEIINSF